jgi:hypothetical protein
MIFLPRARPSEVALTKPDCWAQTLAAHDWGRFTVLERASGCTEEDVDLLLKPMASQKKEPVGSMGDDAPLAALSHRPRRAELWSLICQRLLHVPGSRSE